MNKLKLILILFIIHCALYISPAQSFDDSLAVEIDSLGTNSAGANMGELKFSAIKFPSAMTSDTVFVQTKQDEDGPWLDAYYLSSSGTKTRVHIVVQVSALVGIHPLMTYFLNDWIRIVYDDAEADDRTLTLYGEKLE